jgi:soluble lytic murein transglycosylase
MRWSKICLLVVLVSAARAQAPDSHQMRDISGRWTQHYAALYGVPVELVEAIIDEESGWNPYALSSKGAVGIMQLMPGTAMRFGVHNRFRVDENIHGGVAYLAWLKEKFNGDLCLTTAAYYVGEGPISLRGFDYSSPDVQAYVKRVARRYRARRIAQMESPRQLHKLRWTDEKRTTFRMVGTMGTDGGSQCAASDNRSTSSQQTSCGSQNHHN